MLPLASHQVILRLDLSKPFRIDDYTAQSIDPPEARIGTAEIERLGLFTDFTKIYQIQKLKPSQNISTKTTKPGFSAVQTNELLTFNTETKSWSAKPLRELGFAIPYHGSLISAPDEKTGFWVGGTGGGDQLVHAQALNELRFFDIGSGDWTVEKIPFSSIDGSTVFLGVGAKGILLNLAGQSYSGRNRSDAELTPLDTVRIYDIASRSWNFQGTTGDQRFENAAIETGADSKGIPRGRLSPCSIAIKTGNGLHPSYHIYMIGGLQAANSTGEIWVLSIPSFSWTLLKRDKLVPLKPQCHIIGRSQILLLVDQNGATSDADVCVSELKILDLKTLNWMDTYDPNGKDYVPSDLLSDATTQNFAPSRFSSSFIRDLFYAPEASSTLNSRQTEENSTTTIESTRFRHPVPSSLNGFVPSTFGLDHPPTIWTSLESSTLSTIVSRDQTTLTEPPTSTSLAMSKNQGRTSDRLTDADQWQSLSTSIQTTRSRSKTTILLSSSQIPIQPPSQLIEPTVSRLLNISTTSLGSTTTTKPSLVSRASSFSTLPKETQRSQVLNSKSTQRHGDAVTVISTLKLPQKTVTMHMTLSYNNTKIFQTATSHKRKAVSTSPTDGSGTEAKSFTEIVETPTETTTPTLEATATDENDTLGQQSANMKPYQRTTGIITGSVIAGLGVVGGAVAFLNKERDLIVHQDLIQTNLHAFNMSNDAADPLALLYNTSFNLHKVTPLNVSGSLSSQANLRSHSNRLTNLLRGDVLRGVRVASEAVEDPTSRTGNLKRVDFSAITIPGTGTDNDLKSISVVFSYEKITYSAFLVQDPSQDAAQNPDQSFRRIPTRRASSRAEQSNSYPLLLTRLPASLQSRFIEYLAENFDCHVSSLRIPDRFIIDVVEKHLEAFTPTDNTEDDVHPNRNLQLWLEPPSLPSGDGAGFNKQGKLQTLKTIQMTFSRADLPGMMYKGEELKQKQDKDGIDKRGPFELAFSLYTYHHMGIFVEKMKISKAACGEFVIGTAADGSGKCKFLPTLAAESAIEGRSNWDGIIHALAGLTR
ncbi:hypothetical protein TWF481_006185 [Arthrobotrys musiformis]|uniref:Uncharacterized protein n=1 Tax=Arthrobotrys musiformis TaxID=47236 RepID=A0AAV9WLP0_9PEZI